MQENQQNEIWKRLHIDGLSDPYEVSNLGRLRSFKYHPEGIILQGSVVQGYKAFITRLDNGKSCTRYFHRLVAEAFLAKPDERYKYVIHLDYNKQNNHIDNLRWATKEEKERHQFTGPNVRRGVITNSKLSIETVRLIKQLLLTDTRKLKNIAKQFGITHTQLNRIKKGENWGHVTID
jgi:DNA primase catalytic subunit